MGLVRAPTARPDGTGVPPAPRIVSMDLCHRSVHALHSLRTWPRLDFPARTVEDDGGEPVLLREIRERSDQPARRLARGRHQLPLIRSEVLTLGLSSAALAFAAGSS